MTLAGSAWYNDSSISPTDCEASPHCHVSNRGSSEIFKPPDCTDIDNVLGKPLSFQNCLLLPNITRNLAKNVSPYAGYARVLGYDVGSAVVHGTIDHIETCLSQWCHDSETCGIGTTCSSCSLTADSILYFDPVYDCLEAICLDQSKLTLGVNPDIGGIGVVISLYIQLAFALLGYLLVLYHTARKHLCENSRPGWNAAKKAVRYRHIILVNLVDFHKAQCFFALALNTAAFVSMSKPKSLSFVETAALNNIARAGYMPVVWNHLTLLCFHKFSIYLVILTVLTNIVALVTSQKCYTGGKFQASTAPDECGSHKPYLCTDAPGIEGENHSPGLEDEPGLWTAEILLLFVIILHAALRASSGSIRRHLELRVVKAVPFRRLHLTDIILRVTILVLVVYYIGSLRRIQDYITEQRGWTRWSFGQIVAVTIWAPIALEYIYQSVLEWWHPQRMKRLDLHTGTDSLQMALKRLSITACPPH